MVIIDDSTQPFVADPAHKQALASLRWPVRYRYLSDQRLSIGTKRNLAVETATGAIVITWDDDDFFAPHRISRQVEPIISGRADLTTMAHGVYLWVQEMKFTNWTLRSHEPASPHFGTMCFRRALVADGGLEYPHTSFGEDYGFAERALDRGYRHLVMDNSDGSFV